MDDDGFLAPPGEVADWRRVVLTEAAAAAGILDALPGHPAELAARLGLDAHAVEVVLRALCEWEVVAVAGARFERGAAAPDRDAAAVIDHHARAVRRWSASLTDLRGAPAPDPPPLVAEDRERWLQALAVQARRRAAGLADRCLARFPSARRVLDLAAGHGEYGLEFSRRRLDVTLQDLPETIDIVSTWPSIRQAGVTLFPGDAFERLADGPFDLVLCAGFTHTMPGEQVATLLQRLAAITSPSGAIAIHTLLRGSRPAASIFAMQMPVAGRGGDTHSGDEYRRWLSDAGYTSIEVVDVDGRALVLAGRRG